MDHDDDRGDAMLEERLAGASTRVIARRYKCSAGEVEAAIDGRLDYELSNELRLKAVKLDVARIEALMAPFFERATKDRDVAAGTLCCKLLERRALLLGLDQPIQSRVDVYQLQAQEGPSSFERIREAIFAVARGQPGDGNGADGAVGVLSGSDDQDQAIDISTLIVSKHALP